MNYACLAVFSLLGIGGFNRLPPPTTIGLTSNSTDGKSCGISLGDIFGGPNFEMRQSDGGVSGRVLKLIISSLSVLSVLSFASYNTSILGRLTINLPEELYVILVMGIGLPVLSTIGAVELSWSKVSL